MIAAHALTRYYGRTRAVGNVTFDITGNGIIGLLGHNGAGKSTIMKMLSGYLEPSGGSVEIDGHDMMQDARKVQRTLGYLPESLPLYPEMLVADYLDYAAALKGIKSSNRPAAIREALLATDLVARAVEPIDSLSRGLKQRVGVAQAIIGQPKLLILDEPTNGLDPSQTEQMRELIRRLSRQATVILSTHIMQEVDALCDRVLILNEGRLVLDKSMETLRNSQTLLLRSCQSVSNLGDLLADLPDVASVERRNSKPERAEFLLQINPGADQDTAAGIIGQAVISAGARLYTLEPLGHDLDAIFREATREAAGE